MNDRAAFKPRVPLLEHSRRARPVVNHATPDYAGLLFTGGDAVPRVGKKEFSYSPKGRAAAKRAAKKTGMPVKNKRKKK